MSEVPGGRPDLRVSDAERDTVITELGEHFQAGRLDADEFGQRMDAAASARTRGELDRVMADLPRAAPPAPQPPAQRQGRHWAAIATVVAALAVAAVTTFVVSGVFGDAHGHAGWHWHAGPWWVAVIVVVVIGRKLAGRRGPQ